MSCDLFLAQVFSFFFFHNKKIKTDEDDGNIQTSLVRGSELPGK